MKKKQLENLPLMKIKKKTKKNKIQYLVSASITEITSEKILIVDFYDSNPMDGKAEYAPTYRMCISDKEDFIYEISSKKWYQKKIENLTRINVWNDESDCFEFLDNKSVKEIHKFIPEMSWSNSWYRKIKTRQERFRREKSQRAYDARCDRVSEKNKEIDSLEMPGDFEKFIDESFSDIRYVFYHSKNKKISMAYCAHCKTEREVNLLAENKPKHNEYDECPSCGSRIMYKSPGRTKEIYDTKEVILMQKIDGGFVSRYFNVERTSSEAGEYYQLMEKARVLYNGQRTWRYYNSNGHNDPDNIFWWDSNGGMCSYKVRYGKGILYAKNLEEVLLDTTFKYCAIKLLAEHKVGYEINHGAFLEKFERLRFVEYFIKMGLYNLTNEFVVSSWSDAINSKGKNVLEILKISKDQVNKLIQLDGNLYTLKLLQMESKMWKKFDDEQLKFIGENKLDLGLLNEVLTYFSLSKALRYISEQRRYGEPNKVLQLWVDYLRNCDTLKYDMKNEFVIFPRRLKESHDIAYKAAMDKRNKDRDKFFKEKMKTVKKKYFYETKTFAIVVPESTDEITSEGHKLHHCVGTYIDRVIGGKTVILFVRRKEEIDKPYYTMEVNNGEMVQCRGEYNKDMTEHVKTFVESFESKVLHNEWMKEAI